jgi:hypothetical protein
MFEHADAGDAIEATFSSNWASTSLIIAPSLNSPPPNASPSTPIEKSVFLAIVEWIATIAPLECTAPP